MTIIHNALSIGEGVSKPRYYLLVGAGLFKALDDNEQHILFKSYPTIYQILTNPFIIDMNDPIIRQATSEELRRFEQGGR